MTPEAIAEVCHEANRGLTRIIGDVPVQRSWPEISEDMRTSAIKGVENVLDNPSITPKTMHDMWCLEKFEKGWRYGEERDEEKKTHPALKPYGDLPLATRKKDAVFRAIVNALSGVDERATILEDVAAFVARHAQEPLLGTWSSVADIAIAIRKRI